MTGNECLGDGTSKCQISRVKFDRLFMNRRFGAPDEKMTEQLMNLPIKVNLNLNSTGNSNFVFSGKKYFGFRKNLNFIFNGKF